jgi:hypothetical protein
MPAAYPRLLIMEWIEKNEVRLFFSTGLVTELRLPWVKSAKNARIVDNGLGLDPGDGLEVSAPTLAAHKAAKVLCKARRQWRQKRRKTRAAR